MLTMLKNARALSRLAMAFLLTVGPYAVCSAVEQDEVNRLLGEADKCSADALKAYALATCETSEAIINAALAKCHSHWEEAFAAVARQEEVDPDHQAGMKQWHRARVRQGLEEPKADNPANNRAIEVDGARKAFEGVFKIQHATDVFDVRVASPSKTCISPK
jgi:hypothetical protein